MRKLILALLCLFMIPSLSASGDPVPQNKTAVIHLDTDSIRQEMVHSSEEIADVNNFTTLSKYIKAFANTASPEDQDQIASEMSAFCNDRGLRVSPDTSELFMSLARDAREKKNWKTYHRLARHASTFAPWAPGPHLALAESSRKQDGLFSGNFFYESLMAFIGSFAAIDSRYTAMVNLAIWTRVSFILLLGLMALLMFFKYQKLLRHDVTEWLGGEDSSWSNMAGLIVLFIPSLLLLSGYWWIIYWAGLFILYARWSEKITIFITVIIFVLTGAFSYLTYQNLYLSRVSPHNSNIRCHANRLDMGRDAALNEHISKNDQLDKTFKSILGGRYMLHGSYAKAQNIYLSILKAYPRDYRAANNLGCIYYYENRFEEAIQQFSKAIEAKPSLAVPYFNRSIAKNKVFDFTGSQVDQEKARKLNSNLLASSDIGQSEDWSPLPLWLDLKTTGKIAGKLASEKGMSIEGAIRPGSSLIAMFLQPAFSTWSLLFVIIFTALLFIKKPAFFARACNKCGQPFCARCKTSLEFEAYCSQCVHMFIKQDGVSPEARLKKNYEVRHHRLTGNMANVLFGLVAPGSGQILEGSTITGTAILFLWCALLAGFIAPPFFLELPLAVVTPTTPLATAYFVVGGSFALIVWVVFGLIPALKGIAAQTRGTRS